ncbi:hypothetical protein [Bellilinea caldifistulae]|jgi:hypothetical protein|uniref:Ribbon-helix-helix protein, CopG family n=1 Tax=Bellilinea caldifistulae TaxID=360411 RepID=A0A0N8GMY8_9CHLR|nr:hypothetical protein [Bellilinea caldifistulae]KPL76618.1 hypothetical protein AC812_04665 [Bellilinea caldifistulae]
MKIKGFRLSDETQTQIAWLAKRKGVTATDIVRMAVAEMFQQEIARLPRFRLHERVLYLNEQPVVYCTDRLLTELPETFLLQLEHGTADPIETMIYLIFTIARIGEPVQIDEQALNDLIGWSLPFPKNEESNQDEGRG